MAKYVLHVHVRCPGRILLRDLLHEKGQNEGKVVTIVIEMDMIWTHFLHIDTFAFKYEWD